MVPNLTQREMQIITCIFEGKTSKVIASNLNISIHTVRKHRANLMNKIGAHSERQLLQSSELQVVPRGEPLPLVEVELTNREIEIASLLAQGHSAKYTARVLAISYHTVRKHRENILRKLNIHSTSALVRIWALRPLV